ncbi:MAG: hypothetical protein JXB46_08365, partial [Candidatus Eisenbacteria bacterium]|nr:hypothetical protein [Candidatus Eisenbacteria bacterium]
MTWARKLSVLAMFVAILASGIILGCSKFDPGTRNSNLTPETTLSFAPDEGGTANYRVRMNWFGWDEDGEVVFFETAWDKPDTGVSWSEWIDTQIEKWRKALVDTAYADTARIYGQRVVGTDSVFMWSAASAYDEDQGYATHSFGVRAVDNEGARDPSPESLSFTAETALPETRIEEGPASVTGPMVRFVWGATDFDGIITYYYYSLYQRQDGQWIPVVVDEKVEASRTSVLFGPLAGLHRFEVWAEDDAGAKDQTPAVRQFTCNPELAGPLLTIFTNVFGNHTFRGPVWPDSYNYPEPIFNGERLQFYWNADASDYGGEVTGYRHAYDDTSTWPSWSIFDRRFRVVPTIGRHSLYVSAQDNAEVTTRARIYFDVVEASLDDYIAVVDDYNNFETNPAWGTDEDRNDFYNRILAGYERPRSEWEPADHVIEEPQPPDVDFLRGASTVLWYCDSAGATIEDLFDPFQSVYNSLAGYVRVGGNIILCGRQVLAQISPGQYPIAVDASDTTSAGIFLRDFLHLRRAENSGSNAQPSSPWKYGYCMHGAVPTTDGEALGFEPVYVDTGDCAAGEP